MKNNMEEKEDNKKKDEIEENGKRENKKQKKESKVEKKEKKRQKKNEKTEKKAKKKKDKRDKKGNNKNGARKGKIKIVLLILIIIILIAIIGVLCYGYYKNLTLDISNPIVTMEVENFGTIKIELYPDKAPDTVSNFIALANNGFYDGLTFHRVVEDFMIQGGDAEGDGSGSALLGYLYGTDDETEYSITGEFVANGFTQNDLNLTEGTIAMARSDYTSYSSSLTEESYNSAGTQFFIMTTDDYTSLSGYYAGFGQVIEGMDVVHEIEAVEVTVSEDEEDDEDAEASTPVEDIIITSVTVETYGVDYGYPEILEPFDYMEWIYSLYGLSY